MYKERIHTLLSIPFPFPFSCVICLYMLFGWIEIYKDKLRKLSGGCVLGIGTYTLCYEKRVVYFETTSEEVYILGLESIK